MVKSYSVTVAIPAYNEEAAIGATVSKIRRLYPEYQVLVVDDGSIDKTAQRALEAGAEVIRHPYNIGNGAAVKTAIRHAKGKYIVLMDGDGQHRPEDIAKLLKEIEVYDMVVGARDSKGQASLGRRIANWCYNKLASYVGKFPIKDLTSGFRAFETATVRRYLYLFPNTFSYPTTSTLAYLRSGLTIKYVPIDVQKRIGKSKISILGDGARFILIILRIATLFSPLRVFIPVSFTFFVLGLAYYLYTFTFFHRFTNMSALLLSVSVMVFLLGLVSEQITQMRYDRVEDVFEKKVVKFSPKTKNDQQDERQSEE
ncbi:MAG: glycosyltransferase family 2 protein [Thermodesulfobacteria bacterium]|nr:glycosyltransferase family 2 protein [Thermodesulfobacteriota bacterium]